jgi:hypothetical protein
MEIFHRLPLFWTLQNRKTLFCVFWRLRDLSEIKLAWEFLGVNILLWEAFGAQEVNEGGHEVQMGIGGAGPRPSHTTQPCLVLEPPMLSVFISDWSGWPKNAYIKTPPPPPPEAFPRVGGGKTWNHKIEVVPAKIGGGNATEVTPGRFSNLSDITNTATMMKRE